MRVLLVGCLVLSSSAVAASWGLEWGLAASMGASRFAGEPTPLPPPTDPNNLFALFPPSATGSGGTGLAGAAGLTATLTRGRRFWASLDLMADDSSLLFDETLTFPDGSSLKRTTLWQWSGARADALLGWAWPLKMGSDWALAPRLGAGGWLERVTGRGKSASADGGPSSPLHWDPAPDDDGGWIVAVGLDWLRLGAGPWPGRVGLDLRWREGLHAPEPAVGADKPLRVWEAVLTIPIYLQIL